jgi:hypothetical protein
VKCKNHNLAFVHPLRKPPDHPYSTVAIVLPIAFFGPSEPTILGSGPRTSHPRRVRRVLRTEVRHMTAALSSSAARLFAQPTAVARAPNSGRAARELEGRRRGVRCIWETTRTLRRAITTRPGSKRATAADEDAQDRHSWVPDPGRPTCTKVRAENGTSVRRLGSVSLRP